MKAKSIYIHIPFCKSKCSYCNFISSPEKFNYINNYIESLLIEIDNYLPFNTPISSIYIGGGTPSVLSLKDLNKILAKLFSVASIESDAEITMECNPETVNEQYLENLRLLGINRLSFGVQSFDDRILAKLNRIHSVNDVVKAVEFSKKAGFDNISIDLMYGLPEQDMKIWQETLHKAVNLNVNHISAYGLKIEPDTAFHSKMPESLPDDEQCADMYLNSIEFLGLNGFNHYEISNFSLNGYESRHNLCYWTNNEYFGFGVSAHGYVNGERYANVSDLDIYLKFPLVREYSSKLTIDEKLQEAIFLGLRLSKGINLANLKRIYNVDLAVKYKKIIEKYKGYGFIEIANEQLRLTKEGFLLSNSILADFL